MEFSQFAPGVRLYGASSALHKLASWVTSRTSLQAPDRHASILWVPILLLIAVLCIPLPLPTGVPLVLAALSLLLNRSRRAKVNYIRFKRALRPESRAQRWFDSIDGLLRVKRRKSARITR